MAKFSVGGIEVIKRRCPSDGGLSTGPKTAAGKARIAAAQRARWARFRADRGDQPDQP